jgi:hypothetical protein
MVSMFIYGNNNNNKKNTNIVWINMMSMILNAYLCMLVDQQIPNS